MMRFFHMVLTSFTILAVASPLFAKKRIPLQVEIAKHDVDLSERTVHFKLNKRAKSSEIVVTSPEGKVLAKNSTTHRGAPAGSRLSITWPPLGEHTDNFRLELKITDTDNYWVTWEIVRFYVEIPHEDVVFETGKWNIRDTEAHKLDASLMLLKSTIKKYANSVPCHVYVAGFTDTVGSVDDNRKLSLKRARAIGRYFARRGLKQIPIFVRGFGEEALYVPTGDNVAEDQNRRAVYAVSTFPPDIPGPGTWEQIGR